MVTARGTGAAVAVVGLWVAARSFGVPELHVAAVAMLVVLVTGALWAWSWPVRLTVQRDLRPARLDFGEHARVELQLVNAGRVPTPPLRVRDRVPAALAQGPVARLHPIGPRGRAGVAYQLVGRQRGRFELGPVTVASRDAFGLVERRRTLPGHTEVIVHPPITQLPPGLPLGGASGVSSHGERRASAVGEDLADIREYVRGDDLRSVHWASTAHRGKLMVRRSEDVLTPRATLVLDVRRGRHLGDGPTASIETAVAAAASATAHLAARGRSVVLLDRPVVRPPQPRPWAHWLDHLATVAAEDVDLDAVLRQVATGVAGDGSLLAVVTTPRDHELRSLVRAGRAAASRFALIVDAPSHTGHAHDPATDSAVAGLRAAGWRATPLRYGDHLDDRWRELLGRRARPGREATEVG